APDHAAATRELHGVPPRLDHLPAVAGLLAEHAPARLRVAVPADEHAVIVRGADARPAPDVGAEDGVLLRPDDGEQLAVAGGASPSTFQASLVTRMRGASPAPSAPSRPPSAPGRSTTSAASGVSSSGGEPGAGGWPLLSSIRQQKGT